MRLSISQQLYLLLYQPSFLILQFREQFLHLVDPVSNALADMRIGCSDAFPLLDVLVLLDLVPATEELFLQEVELTGSSGSL